MNLDIKENVQKTIHELFIEQLRSALERVKLEDAVVVIIHLVVIIGAGIISTWVMRIILNHMIHQGHRGDEELRERDKRSATLLRIVRQMLTFLIWGVLGLMALKEIGIDIRPLLASAGVIGLAIGFGAQNLVKDFISGLFIIMENQVRVGDTAQLNGMTGTIERITLRAITMRDPYGIVHIIPNGSITNVSNHTLLWSAYVFEIGVAYKSNTDQVAIVLHKVFDEMKADPTWTPRILGEMEYWGVDQFRDSDVKLMGRIRTKPGQHKDVGREFLRRVKFAFDREGIEIPFPQRTVHLREESGEN